MHIIKKLVCLLAISGLIACSRTSGILATPEVSTAGTYYTHNLTIRIDSVELLNNTKDLDGEAEATFALLAARTNGDSRRLLAPSEGYYSMSLGNKQRLGGFSLTVNEIADEEKLKIILIGFESDDSDIQSNLANEVLTVALDLAVDYALPVDGEFVSYIASYLSEDLAKWLREQNILGEHTMEVSLSDADTTQTIYSTNGNLKFEVTILATSESSPAQSIESSFTIKNVSNEVVQKIYYRQIDASTYNQDWVAIEIGQTHVYHLPAGNYDFRIESQSGFTWEKLNLHLSGEETWTLSDS